MVITNSKIYSIAKFMQIYATAKFEQKKLPFYEFIYMNCYYEFLFYLNKTGKEKYWK